VEGAERSFLGPVGGEHMNTRTPIGIEHRLSVWIDSAGLGNFSVCAPTPAFFIFLGEWRDADASLPRRLQEVV